MVMLTKKEGENMKDSYKTIHSYGEGEILIKKSRFIGYSKPVDTEEEALEFIGEIKEKHKDATHNVYAYVIGEASNIQRYSDDGEPSGTAGIPILEVLKKEELRNTIVVVTRYFGGIKLGAGGLIRSYIKGAKVGLDASKIVEKVLYSRIKFTIEYTLYGKVENELLAKDYKVEDIVYDEAVNLVVLCRKENSDQLIDLIKNLTSANMTHEYLEEEYFSVKNGEIIS